MIGRPPKPAGESLLRRWSRAGPPVHSHSQSLTQVVVWPVGSCVEGQQLEVGRVLGVDDVDAGDVGRAVRVRLARLARRRAAVGARVAREQRELALVVDVHVLVLPERGRRVRRRVRRVARQPQLLGGDLVQELRLGRVGQVIRLQAEAARDEHDVLALVLVLALAEPVPDPVEATVPAILLAVGHEVDRGGVGRLRQVVQQLDVLDRAGRLRRSAPMPARRRPPPATARGPAAPRASYPSIPSPSGRNKRMEGRHRTEMRCG